MELVFEMVSAQQFTAGMLTSKTFKQAGGVIGRAEDCDWVIPDRKRILSGHHAEVSYREGAFYLTNTSSNGIQLKDSGASLSGATIRLNSGGAPGSGSGIQILGPLIPGAADTDKAGNLVDSAKANTTWLELNLHYPNLEPVPHAAYRVEFSDGSRREGQLDAQGHARLEDVPIGPVKVYYGEDPRPYSRHAIKSVRATGEKIEEDLRKLGLEPDAIDLQALIEQAAGRMM